MGVFVKELYNRGAGLLAGEIDFYDSEAHAGDSYWPFIGFMVFLAGFVIIFIGSVKLISAKRQFNIFYDQRDRKDFTEEKYVKEKRVGMIMIVVGVVLLIGSFLIY